MAKKLDYEYCKAAPMLEWLGNKWALVVLVKISENEPVRFNELYRNIPSISEKVLSQVLRQMTTDGIIRRELFPDVPPRTEYSVTDFGNTLLPHVKALINWGRENFDTIMSNRKKTTMSNEVLYILLPDFAAHEVVFLSQAIASDEYALKDNPKYVNRIVAPTMEPVKSIGGFRTLPDYSFDTMPEDYAALVLIGGFGWSTPIAKRVEPIVRKAIEKGRITGAICNAASFMAKHGFLNAVKHTGNGPEQLKSWGGENYTNRHGYIHAQAVSDNNIVTANGSATLEFAKELLLLLENDTPERIEMYYQFNKQGFCALFPPK